MEYNKESLSKLVNFISEITNLEDYKWFKDDLIDKININSGNGGYAPIDEIYEYCIQLIIKEQAVKFYEDFKLVDIKDKLIEDFVRMEKFKREDNFEDFCLALFQQLEGMVNRLVSLELEQFIKYNKDKSFHKERDKISGILVEQKLWLLIFNPALSSEGLEKKLTKSIYEWDFVERFKSVLFYYYFNKKINNYHNFSEIFFMGRELYLCRNQNHRGSLITESNQITIDRIKSNSYRYYYKFLGFFEDFCSTVNRNI